MIFNKKQRFPCITLALICLLAAIPVRSLRTNNSGDLSTHFNGKQQDQQETNANHGDNLAGLMRTRRAPPGAFNDPLSAPISPTAADLTPRDAFGDATLPSGNDFNGNADAMKSQESRLRNLIRQISSNPYMPSQDQLVQLFSIALTMVLMAYLGPLAGSNAAFVSTVVKQIIPVLVASAMSYATTQPELDDANGVITAQVANIDLKPVNAPNSMISQIA